MYKEKKILIVDDEEDFMLDISRYLASKGFFVYQTKNISEFKANLEEHAPDIALIDKNIGYENGFELISYVRNHDYSRNMPIIVITGVANPEERLEAFKIGADDLIAKPVGLTELELRIQACLRRSGSYLVSEQVIDYDNIHVNLRTHEVFIGQNKIDLTNTEYKIFLELIMRKGEVLNRERLVSKVLSVNNSSLRTLDVHINSLRKKLGDHAKNIKTVRGRGYLFRDAI